MSDHPVIYWCLNETGLDGAGLTIGDPGEILSPIEMNRYTQMRFPKRREEWLLGRYTVKSLMKSCIEELAGVDYHRLTIANQAKGAPYAMIDGRPLAVQISISHREKWAAAAVTLVPAVGLGIDLEWVEERDVSFYDDYFTARESMMLRNIPSDQMASIGTVIWSAKEAMLKALGQGLRMDTRSIEVLRIANDSEYGWQGLDLQSPAISNINWFGCWNRVGNYICTVALTNAEFQPVLIQRNLQT